MKNRRLPPIFWLIILAAIATALFLIVGIALENKDKLPSFGLTLEESEDAAPPAPEPPLRASESSCQGRTIQVGIPEGHALVGWGTNPYDLSLFTLDPAKQILREWRVSTARSSPEFTEASAQALVCETTQGATCYYPTVQTRKIEDIWLERGIGWARFRDSADNQNLVPVKLQEKGLTLHPAPGVCGRPLSAKARLLVHEFEGMKRLLAVEEGTGLLLEYFTFFTRPFSAVEVPTAPDRAWTLTPQGLEPYQCANPQGGLVVEKASIMGGSLALISSSGGMWDETGLWIFSRSGEGWVNTSRMDSRSLAGSLSQVAWMSPEKLLFSTVNFFQTRRETYETEPAKGKAHRFEPAGLVPARSFLSREQQLGSASQGPLTVFLDGVRREKGSFQWGNSRQFPLEGRFSDEQPPKVLWTDRKNGSFLILSQATPADPIRGLVVECSLKQ